jgi:IPT/TIG domain/Metallo-peptidase family M12B Reprolysin-like
MTGAAGAQVTLAGVNFTGTTSVQFHGTSATAFQVVNDSQITATVPASATTGPVSVTTPLGTGSSATSFTVMSPISNGLDLALESWQINQGVQDHAGTVPLVAGRDGVLRVFVIANGTNTATPIVQVTLNGGTPTNLAAPTGVTSLTGVPQTFTDADTAKSWNMTVPGAQIHSGMTLKIEVDPSHSLGETNLTNNVVNAAPTATTVGTFHVTLVPILSSDAVPLTGNIDSGSGRTLASWTDRFKRMYPVVIIDPQKRSTPLLTTGTFNTEVGTSWDTCLKEVEAARKIDLGIARKADPSSPARYYFGVVATGYDNGQAGLGYVPNSMAPTSAIGWDKIKPSATGYTYYDGGHYPEIFAHEVGHNLGREHAPYGVTGPTDANWPSDSLHTGAHTGYWGWDGGYATAVPAYPDTTTPWRDPSKYLDIMSYGHLLWVSDYTYKGILAFTSAMPDVVSVADAAAAQVAVNAPVQECLLVSGEIREGQASLESTFQVETLPDATEGSYRIQLLDASGAVLTELAFNPMAIGDHPDASLQHFVVSVPMSPAIQKTYRSIRIQKDAATLLESTPRAEASFVGVREPVATRMRAGQTHVSWDAAIHSKIMICDTATGEVLGFAKGGSVDLPVEAQAVDVHFSNGTHSVRRRMTVQE